jgi:hypothetical protein
MVISEDDLQGENSAKNEGFLDLLQFLWYDFIYLRTLRRIEPGSEWIFDDGDRKLLYD